MDVVAIPNFETKVARLVVMPVLGSCSSEIRRNLELDEVEPACRGEGQVEAENDLGVPEKACISMG